MSLTKEKKLLFLSNNSTPDLPFCPSLYVGIPFSLHDFNQHVYFMFQVHIQTPNCLMSTRLKLSSSLPVRADLNVSRLRCNGPGGKSVPCLACSYALITRQTSIRGGIQPYKLPKATCCKNRSGFSSPSQAATTIALYSQ